MTHCHDAVNYCCIEYFTVSMNIKYFSVTEEFEPSVLPVTVAFYKLFFHNLNHYWFLSKMYRATSEENEYLETLLNDFTGIEDKHPVNTPSHFKACRNFRFA